MKTLLLAATALAMIGVSFAGIQNKVTAITTLQPLQQSLLGQRPGQKESQIIKNVSIAPKSPSKTVEKSSNTSAVPPEPQPEPHMITVKSSEYLEKIAVDNQTTALRLFYANTDIANPDLIYPDQQLRVPVDSETLTAREVPINKQIPTPTPTQSTQAIAPQTRTASPVSAVSVADGSVWDRIAACESGGNWAISTGNGFYGGLQFTLSSWAGVGGSGYPNQASREEQIARGQLLQARQGWGAWPACSAKLGL